MPAADPIVEMLAFYLFAAVAVGSAAMVVTARNPVHAVLFLILTFINAAGLFVLLGAEFLAMLLVVVYVGAVMVLFLFVVMMLDINILRLREGAMRYLPVGAMIGLVLLAELILVGGTWALSAPEAAAVAGKPTPTDITNTEALGRVLYTDYVLLFQTAGIILLVGMVGTIMLTLRRRAGVRRQDIGAQTARRKQDTIEVVKVPSGKGI